MTKRRTMVNGKLNHTGPRGAAIALASLLAAGLSAIPTQADTHTVGASGCDFTTIQAAIDDGGTLDGDTIQVVDAVHTEHGITVSKNLAIEGTSATETMVQAHADENSAADRVFSIQSGKTVMIRDMTIRHGSTWMDGGGVYNQGVLTLARCVISNNSGGDLEGRGGGVYNSGTIEFQDCTISNNTCEMGEGGGFCSSNGGTLVRCTISGNYDRYFAGGVACWAGTLVLVNCTLSGNSSYWEAGGLGLWGGIATITNCTITANTSTSGEGTGGININNGAATLTNSIVAGNTGLDADVHGTFSSGGYNLVGSNSGAEASFPAGSPNDNDDWVGTSGALLDPLLGALADNGGPTLTHALETGSPALNKIANGVNGMGTAPLDVDQRSEPRPAGGDGDIGAYEAQGAASTPTVTTASATLSGTTGFDAGGNVTDDGGDAVTARGVCYGTSPDPDIDSDSYSEDGSGTGEFTSDVSGVAENTHYYFRAYATNGAGTAYGEQRTIITGSSNAAHGYAWTERRPAGDANQSWECAAMSSDGSTLIAGVWSGRLYTSGDAGATWTERQPAGNANKYWKCVGASYDGTRLIAGVSWGGRLYTSSNAGAAWTERQPAGDVSKDWNCAAMSSDGTKMIVGIRDGRLYTSADSGATWTERQPAGDVDKIWCSVAVSSDGTKMYAGVDAGRLYASNDSGATWSEQQPAGEANKTWIATRMSTDGVHVLAVACNGRLYTSDDSGTTWAEHQPAGGTGSSWYCAGMSASGAQMLAGILWGRVYISSDAGTTWTETQPAGDADKGWSCAGVSSDGATAVIGAGNGRLYTAVGALVPTVTTAAVSDVTTTTAASGGNVTAEGGADVTARGVCWSTAEDPTTENDLTEDGTGTGEFSSSITDLSPGTTYHVRAHATNSVGTGYGDDVEFTTSTTTPTVTTAAVSDITTTTATSGGDVTATGGASVTAYGVCWSASADPTIADRNTADGTGTGEYTSSITGLSPGTTYHVRAYATNSVGTAYGEDVEFTTTTTTPTVTTATVSDITTTTATCGGNVSSDGGTSVTARGVCWSTSADPSTDDDKTEDGSGTGEFSSRITGLTLGTTYYVRAYATNSVGTGYGADVELTTSAVTPSVTTVDISDITTTTAAGGGNVTATGGASVTARGVCWSTAENPTTADSKTTDGTGTGAFVSSITGLSPGTTYYVRAYATNTAGTAYGPQVSFTTAAAEDSDEDPGDDDPNDVPADDGGDDAAPRSDLRVTITSPTASAEVGDELTFWVVVENVGDASASDAVLTLPLPPDTDFVSAWSVTSPAGQSVPLEAHVEDGEIVIELGEVAAGEERAIELVLRARASGVVTLTAQVAWAESGAPATTRVSAEVDVEDVYWQVVNTIVPAHTCGWLGAAPMLVFLGLIGMKRRHWNGRGKYAVS